MTLISLNKVCKTIGKKSVLTLVSAMFPKTGLVCLIGNNGSGKTSLLRLIAGVDKNYTGHIEVSGKKQSAFSLKEYSFMLSWLPNQTLVPFGFTPRELIQLGRYNRHLGFPTKQDSIAVEGIIARTKIGAYADLSFVALSTGEQRKVLLARALASDVPIVVLDEPLSSLDPRAAFETMELLKQEAEHRLIILSAHHLELVQRFADLIFVLDKGRMIGQGSPQVVLSASEIKTIFHLD